MPTSQNSPHIKFLNLIDTDRINPGKKLDCIEEGLLDKIIACAHVDQPILVGDLISLTELGSQATLHGRLKKSKRYGLHQNGSQYRRSQKGSTAH